MKCHTPSTVRLEVISIIFTLKNLIWVSVHWLVNKHGGRVWPCCLQILHGVPLVDAALIWSNAALIVAHPGESHTSREVVVPAWHLTCLVQHLDSWPKLWWKRKIKVIEGSMSIQISNECCLQPIKKLYAILCMCPSIPAGGRMRQRCINLLLCSRLQHVFITCNRGIYCAVSWNCRQPPWLQRLFITHHIACTETGLKTWVRPAVFTVKPLRSKQNRWSFPEMEHHVALCVCVMCGVKGREILLGKFISCVLCPYRRSYTDRGNSPISIQMDFCVTPQR